MKVYLVTFTAEAEFAVIVDADSEDEAMQKFVDDEANWNTLRNTGNWEPAYVEDPAADGTIVGVEEQ